jgi:hypothetical protein
MFKIKIVFALLLVLLQAKFSFGQSLVMKQYNREFPNINSTFVCRNPANIDTNGRMNFAIGYNGFSKLSENLKSYIFLGNFRLSSNGIQHHIGFHAYSHQEGRFIRQYVGHLRYSQSIQLAENTFFNSGISFGFFNQQIVPNEVTGGASSMTPDGTIGLKLSHVRSSIGISASQLLNSKYTSFERPAELIRTYYAHISQELFLDMEQLFSVEGSFILKSPDQFKTYTGWLSTKFSYNKLLEMNVLFNDLQSYSVGIAFLKIRLVEQDLGIRVNYFAPFIDKNYANFSNVEIGLSYIIH